MLHKRRGRRLYTATYAILLIFTLALLSACGSGRGESATEPKIMVAALSQEPNHLNPILISGMFFQDSVIRSMFSPLFRIRPDASIELILAAEIPTVANGLISEDFLTYTIPLRTDALWSDGTPFTSADIKFSVERIQHPDVVPRTLVGFEKIASVETPDDHTVVFHLTEIYPPFISTLAKPDIIPKHIWEDVPPAEMNESPMNMEPKVTLGPFTFEEWVHGDHITVVKDPNYFNPAGVDKFVFRIMPDQNSILAALLRGDVHFYWFLPPEHQSIIEEDPNAFMALGDPPLWWEHIRMNFANPSFDDVRVRQALNYSFDKDMLIEVARQGMGLAYGSPIGPASWAYNEAVGPYPFDVDRANQLLDEAGWVMGSDGVRHRDGERLEFVYSTTAGNPWREQTQRVLQDQWSNIGVEANIRNVDAATFFGTLLPSGKPGADVGGWDLSQFQTALSWDPAEAIQQQFHTRGNTNHGNYVNPRIDELIALSNSTVVQDDRLVMFHEMAEIFHEDAAAVYLYIVIGGAGLGVEVDTYVHSSWDVYTWNIEQWSFPD